MKRIDEESKKAWDDAISEEKKVKLMPLETGLKKGKTFGGGRPIITKSSGMGSKTRSDLNAKGGKPSVGKKPVGTIFAKK